MQCKLHTANLSIFYRTGLTVNDIADLLEDNPWDSEDISGEDSGSDKDWGPAQDQEDSFDSNIEPDNNEAGVVASGTTSSGNRAM